MSAERVPYAGIATRAVALGIDALITQAIFVTGAALVGLAASLVGGLRPEWLAAIVAGLGWALTVGIYFIAFWTGPGQTPGMRVMQVRVRRANGAPLHAGRGVVRLAGLLLSIVPLFAGFLPVLFDDRRRGLADFLAGTVVLYAGAEPGESPDRDDASSARPGVASRHPTKGAVA
jgi:uncharacterized RDD family membrane protein YckC